MNRNFIFPLITALVINNCIFTLNVSAQCGPYAPIITKIEGKDAAEIQKNLSDQTKNDLRLWDQSFKKVRIGKTTQAELLHGFTHLKRYYNSSFSTTYAYDDVFSSGSLTSYGFEYKFTVSDSTKLVENKEKYFVSFRPNNYNGSCLKPVIYFYPTKEEEVSVRLHYAGDITVSYPRYDTQINGWNIRTFPDGKIIDRSDQEEYSYIFWEGSPSNVQYDLSEGFIVEGDKSEAFLRETLKKMGLKPREYNEFIVYWYPKLKNNKYNLVHFAHEEYENIAKLEITPRPDSLLRVFMVYKPLTEKIEIKPQEIKPFNRTGFTVIEWGGTELSKM